MGLVSSVYTLSGQLQATGAPGADAAYLWACYNEGVLCTVTVTDNSRVRVYSSGGSRGGSQGAPFGTNKLITTDEMIG